MEILKPLPAGLLIRSRALFGFGAFLVTALLKLATDAVGCETERLPGESKVRDCNNKVHGMKPSSLTTVYATAIGLAAALVMPVVGTIVNTTPYRRSIRRLLAGWLRSLTTVVFVGRYVVWRFCHL